MSSGSGPAQQGRGVPDMAALSSVGMDPLSARKFPTILKRQDTVPIIK
jgi:hypothetical protein